MSFAYFPFYTGDYYRDTRHLSMLQHGAYRLLLDHCWDQKGPLPLDLEKCYRICGAVSKEEQECVRGIVAEFFVTMEDGHYQKRVMEEVAKAESWSLKSREGGLKSAIARRSKVRDAVAERVVKPPLNHPSTTVEPPSVSPSPSLTPTLIPTPKAKTKTVARTRANASRVSVDDLIAEGVVRQHAEDWLAVRAAKHLPLTRTAWENTKVEAEKAGVTPALAVETSARSGWAGFKASWMQQAAPMRKSDAVIAGNIAAAQRYLDRQREKERTFDVESAQ